MGAVCERFCIDVSLSLVIIHTVLHALPVLFVNGVCHELGVSLCLCFVVELSVSFFDCERQQRVYADRDYDNDALSVAFAITVSHRLADIAYLADADGQQERLGLCLALLL